MWVRKINEDQNDERKKSTKNNDTMTSKTR